MSFVAALKPMIRSVDFTARVKAEALQERDDLAIISITEPESSPAVLSCREEKVLRLVFHDVDPGNETTSSWTLFDESCANQVVNFVRRLHAHDQSFDLVIHCKAGISRSAAIALFAESETGCDFPRRPFAGLANMHVIATLEKSTGKALLRPRALPKRETFSVSVFRNFETGQAVVTVVNERNGEQVNIEGPMIGVPALAADGMQRVWGVSEPPASYHVADWDTLSQGLGALSRTYDRHIETSIRPSAALVLHRAAIRRIVAENDATNPRVFGSVARGDDTENSDLDILVDPIDGRTTLLSLAAIASGIQGLTGCKVDVTTPEGLKERMRIAVLEEARPI